jgi:sporulation protein YlmC with PRC-barrel domain
MTNSQPIDLALGLLDHQLFDCTGRRCGKVDDIDLEGVSEGDPHVAAIVTGRSAWSGRGPLGRMAAALARGHVVRIPWGEVKEIDSAIHLRKGADELRLGRADERASRWVGRLPGSR